jgi:hypothetical protein
MDVGKLELYRRTEARIGRVCVCVCVCVWVGFRACVCVCVCVPKPCSLVAPSFPPSTHHHDLHGSAPSGLPGTPHSQPAPSPQPGAAAQERWPLLRGGGLAGRRRSRTAAPASRRRLLHRVWPTGNSVVSALGMPSGTRGKGEGGNRAPGAPGQAEQADSGQWRARADGGAVACVVRRWRGVR